jgi:hypothetical protein
MNVGYEEFLKFCMECCLWEYNVVCKRISTRNAMVRNFEVMCDGFNIGSLSSKILAGEVFRVLTTCTRVLPANVWAEFRCVVRLWACLFDVSASLTMQDLPVKYAVWILRGDPLFYIGCCSPLPNLQSFLGLSIVCTSCEGLPVCCQLHITLSFCEVRW